MNRHLVRPIARITPIASCAVHIGLLLCLSHCRTSARSSVTPDDPIAITVTLYQVTDADLNQYKLNVQMALCSDATGTKVEGTTYKFMVPSLARDTICQIHVVGAKGPAAGVQFYTNSDGLYYKDDQVAIKADASGALKGDAYLQALFSPNLSNPLGSTTWQITAPVTSKTALTDTCTCNLDCTPDIKNHNALMAKGGSVNEGVCTFINLAYASVPSVQCSKLTLQCGEAFYAGVYNPPVSVEASANKSTKLPAVELQPGVPTTDGDVTIDVQFKNKP